MTKLLLIGILVIFNIISCKKSESTSPEIVTVQDLLPKSNDISGWQRGNNFWTANNRDELTAEINGAEVIYTRNGFVEAAMQTYEGVILGNNAIVQLEIFDQGNGANSKTLFDEIVLQLVNPLDWTNGAGEEAKIERFPMAQKIVFPKSKYYISLSIGSGIDEALDVLKTFANNVNSKIQ